MTRFAICLVAVAAALWLGSPRRLGAQAPAEPAMPVLNFDASGNLISMTPSIVFSANMGCVSKQEVRNGQGVVMGTIYGTNAAMPDPTGIKLTP